MTDVFFNPLDDGYVANPFPHLAEMREQLPVQQTLAGPWAVFRNDDVTRLLREPGLSVDAQNIESEYDLRENCLLYTSPSPRDATLSRMPSSA